MTDVTTAAPAGGLLDGLPERYCAELERLGYRRSTVRGHLGIVRRLCRIAAECGIAPHELTPERIIALLGHDAARSSPRRATVAVARRVAGLLAAPRAADAPAPLPAWQRDRAALRRDYESYLRHQRGLSERTIEHCWRFADRFLAFRFGEAGDAPGAITPGDVAAFLQHLTARGSPFRDRTPPTHLRSFLRYLFRAGLTPANLAPSVPSVAHRYGRRLPRDLPPEGVEAVLAAVRAVPRLGRRNHAMVLLQARLGLRAPEVVAIRLDDLDWRTGELLVRGKGGLHDRLPLPPDVGEAIAGYLRHDRVSASRALFVTDRAPHGPFRDGQVLNTVLRTAFASAGVTPPPPYAGSHVLRHSLAAHLVRRGASLDEVAEVLRHRSRATTLLYARLDIEGLRGIAQPWPAAGDAP